MILKTSAICFHTILKNKLIYKNPFQKGQLNHRPPFDNKFHYSSLHNSKKKQRLSTRKINSNIAKNKFSITFPCIPIFSHRHFHQFLVSHEEIKLNLLTPQKMLK